MAVVGEAKIIVRAITDTVRRDIQNALSGMDKIGADAGKALSKGFNKEASNLSGYKSVRELTNETKRMTAEARKAADAWRGLVQTGFTLGPIISTLVGAVSSLIGSLLSVVGAAGAAGASLVVLGNVVSAMGLAMLSAKIALGGVMEALGKMGKGGGGAAKATDAIRRAQERLAQVIEQNNEAIVSANNRITDAQLNLNDALAAGREELQQLGFEAERAALAERGAALDLERAREELARVQDLPPNSRIRREAELAFAQAELQYRQALDANADIAAEQDRYTESGVEGTQQVIDARRELAEAEADLARTVRDGLRAQIEAERALAEARKGSGGGGADPFEGLTKTQKIFVKEMYKLKPLFEGVQEQVAAAFLPLLGGAIERFAKNVLPTVGSGLAAVGTELGRAAAGAVRFLQSAEGLSLLDSFFKNSARLISPMSKAFGELMKIVLRLMDAASPQAERFVNWIRTAFETFNGYLNSLPLTGPGSLGEFFQQSGDAASEFGELFGEIFRYIGQLIKVNLGEDSPGRDFVRWLGDGLKAANDIRESNLFGPNGLAAYFEKVNTNTKKIFSSLGALGRVLAEVGTNQAIGDTFAILSRGSGDLIKVVNAFITAAPSLAKLFNTVLGIAEVFTDSQSIQVYFDILSQVAEAFLDFISLPPIKAFIDIVGPIAATFLAIGKAVSIAQFALLAIIGIVTKFALGIDAMILGTGKLTLAFGAMKAAIISAAESMALWVMTNPILAAISAALILVVGGFMLLDNHIKSTAATAEDFQNAIDNNSDSLATLDALTKKVTLNEMFDPTQIDKNAESMKDLNKNYDAGTAAWATFNNVLSLGLVPLRDTITGNYDAKSAVIDTTNAIHDFNTTAAELPADVVVRGLQKIVDGGNASADTTLEMINSNDNLKDSLIQVANEAGIVASDSNLVSIAMGEMKDAALDAALGLPTLGEELKNLSQDAADTMRAEISLNEAWRDATKTAQEYAGYLTGNQEQQDRANTVLLDTRDAIYENVDAMRLQGESAEDISKFLGDQRQQFIDLAKSMGLSQTGAEELANELLAQPSEVETVLKQRVALDTSSAKAEITQFANYVTGQFSGKLPTSIVDAINKYIKLNYKGPAITRTSGAGSNVLGRTMNAVGNMYSYGGEGIYSGRAAGIHKFAEPETGWEAFISGRKGSEDRNRGILKEAASRLGMNIGGGGVSITVNPSPGMDERALAGAVSQEITKLMRKGSIY